MQIAGFADQQATSDRAGHHKAPIADTADIASGYLTSDTEYCE